MRIRLLYEPRGLKWEEVEKPLLKREVLEQVNSPEEFPGFEGNFKTIPLQDHIGEISWGWGVGRREAFLVKDLTYLDGGVAARWVFRLLIDPANIMVEKLPCSSHSRGLDDKCEWCGGQLPPVDVKCRICGATDHDNSEDWFDYIEDGYIPAKCRPYLVNRIS